jgi:type I restriction enzyme S subunit
MANLNQKILNEALFPLPPVSEQRVIVAKINEQLARCNQLYTLNMTNKKNAEILMQVVLKEEFTLHKKSQL